MNYIGTPLSFQETEHGISIERSLENRRAMLDGFIELIVYSSCGSFNADPDFGLWYWEREYSNLNMSQFNSNTPVDNREGFKQRCEQSIVRSLRTYVPEFRDVRVSMTLSPVGDERPGRRKVMSKHLVTIVIEGKMDNGLNTDAPYSKEVSFYAEPTAKKQ